MEIINQNIKTCKSTGFFEGLNESAFSPQIGNNYIFLPLNIPRMVEAARYDHNQVYKKE